MSMIVDVFVLVVCWLAYLYLPKQLIALSKTNPKTPQDAIGEALIPPALAMSLLGILASSIVILSELFT